MVKVLGAQAAILLKNGSMDDLFKKCANEEEKKMMLAIASMYALVKANA